MPHHWLKMRVEELLFASGLAFTILQPAAYMQNVLAHWDRIVGEGVYPVPYPVETRLSLVDLEDVAEAAAIVLTEPGHAGATYELAGPEALTQTEVANILGQQLGRTVHAQAVPLTDWEHAARAAGLGDYPGRDAAPDVPLLRAARLLGQPACVGLAAGPPADDVCRVCRAGCQRVIASRVDCGVAVPMTQRSFFDLAQDWRARIEDGE